MHRREFVRRSAQTAIGFGILHRLGACRPGTSPGSSFAQLRDGYFVRTLELSPVVSTYLGGDGYSPALAEVNGRLRDFRPEALAAEARYYREVRSRLEAVDRERLSASERIDAAVLEAQLAFLLRQIEDRRHHERC